MLSTYLMALSNNLQKILGMILLSMTLLAMFFYFEVVLDLFITIFFLFISYIVGLSIVNKVGPSIKITLGIAIITLSSLMSLLIKDGFLLTILIISILSIRGIKRIIKREVVAEEGRGKFPTIFILIAILTTLIVVAPEYTESQDQIFVGSASILYEISASKSLELNPIQDISYAGKEIKWHLGIPALYSFLDKIFISNNMEVAYILLSLFMILSLLNCRELMISLKMRKYYNIIPFLVIFFPHQLFPWGYVLPTSYFTLFSRMLLMNSFNFAFTLTLALLSISISREKSPIPEIVFLVALSIVKFTIFATIIGGYILYSLILFFIHKRILWKYFIATILGLSNYFLLLSGAHQHNKITLLPGESIKFLLLKSSKVFRGLGNYAQIIITAFVAIIVSLEIVWIGIFFLLKRGFICLKESLSSKESLRNILIPSILISGLSLFFFINEISENNSIQFLLPVILLGSIVSWYLILNYINNLKIPYRYIIIFLLIGLLAFNFYPSGRSYVIYDVQSTNSLDSLSMKISIFYNKVRLATAETISFGLLSANGVGFSNKYSYFDRSLFKLNHLDSERKTITDLKTIVNCEIGYSSQTISAATGLLQYQESFYERGAISQSDYFERVDNNLRFFSFLTGNSSSFCKDIKNKYNEILTQSNQQNNIYYTAPSKFVSLLTSNITPMNYLEAKNFVKENNISIILSHRQLNNLFENITLIKTISKIV